MVYVDVCLHACIVIQVFTCRLVLTLQAHELLRACIIPRTQRNELIAQATGGAFAEGP